MAVSPYIIDRGIGIAHIRLAANPKDCIACVRLDALELLYHHIRAEVVAEVREMVERQAIGGAVRGNVQ